MNILIINPIIYTSETKQIPKVKSIKDSMIYDLCIAFHNMGHTVTLIGASPYKPSMEEVYPFKIIWGNCICQKLFMPHRFPVMPKVYKYIKKNKDNIDLIITSEVFSFSSLMAYKIAPDKTIIWHELAKHNAMLKQIPSKIWYSLIVRLFLKKALVVARSQDARVFISRYCKNTHTEYIDHGVNLQKFEYSGKKENYFVVCSQLIARKRIDGIILKFSEYLKEYDNAAKLYIIGDGELQPQLEHLVQQLKIENSVIFTGRLNHAEMRPFLAKAKAMLVNTEKDNSMISIVESIAAGTPVVTTDVPLNSKYIIENKLGIAKPEWNEQDLHNIAVNNSDFVNNCLEYRRQLSTEYRVEQFLKLVN